MVTSPLPNFKAISSESTMRFMFSGVTCDPVNDNIRLRELFMLQQIIVVLNDRSLIIHPVEAHSAQARHHFAAGDPLRRSAGKGEGYDRSAAARSTGRSFFATDSAESFSTGRPQPRQ